MRYIYIYIHITDNLIFGCAWKADILLCHMAFSMGIAMSNNEFRGTLCLTSPIHCSCNCDATTRSFLGSEMWWTFDLQYVQWRTPTGSFHCWLAVSWYCQVILFLWLLPICMRTWRAKYIPTFLARSHFPQLITWSVSAENKTSDTATFHSGIAPQTKPSNWR